MENISNNMWDLLPVELRPSSYDSHQMAKAQFFQGDLRIDVRFIAFMPGRNTYEHYMDNLDSMNKNKSYRIKS